MSEWENGKCVVYEDRHGNTRCGVSKAPKHKTEVHKMAWLYIPAETGERIETICNQHYNPGRGACDCPLWPACSYSNDLTKSNAENTRIFEQGMAAALAALDNENRR